MFQECRDNITPPLGSPPAALAVTSTPSSSSSSSSAAAAAASGRSPVSATVAAAAAAAAALSPTPIACLNCSRAKTGCDKRVPCTRCAGKKLDCAPRFARRQSKAAIRARETSIELHKQMASLRERLQHGHGSPSYFLNYPQAAPHIENHHWHGVSYGGGGGAVIQPSSSSHPNHETRLVYPQSLNHGGQQILQGYSPYWATNGPYVEPHPSSILPIVERDLVNSSRSLSDSSPLSGSSRCAESPFTTSTISASSEYSGVSTCVGSHTSDQSPVLGSLGVQPRNFIGPQIATVMAVAEGNKSSDVHGEWLLARCNDSFPDHEDNKYSVSFIGSAADMDDTGWGTLTHSEYPAPLDTLEVVDMTQRYRDSLMAALSACKLERNVSFRSAHSVSFTLQQRGTSIIANFEVPPTEVLTWFLHKSVHTFSRYYPLHQKGVMNPNELAAYSCRLSALLNLSMIVRGASVVQDADAQSLTEVLAEVCRTMFPQAIGRISEVAREADNLHVALMIAMHGAWSGDGELMRDAIVSRSACIESIRANVLRQRYPHILKQYNHTTGLDHVWETWSRSELCNRLVYNWVLLDQEISLFYDTSPQLCADELRCPLPSVESLWKCRTAVEWAKLVRTHDEGDHTRLPTAASLQSLFVAFQAEELISELVQPRSQTLQLLLYPIQALIHHLRQSQVPYMGTSSPPGSHLSLESAQDLLAKWYKLATSRSTGPDTGVSPTCWLLYHLVYLNTMLDFSKVERLARREVAMDLQSAQDAQAIELHCSQALDRVRHMIFSLTQHPPAWWPVAVYRLTLISWAIAVILPQSPSLCLDTPRPQQVASPAGDAMFDMESSAFLYDTGLDGTGSLHDMGRMNGMDGVVHDDWPLNFDTSLYDGETEAVSEASAASNSPDMVLAVGLSLLERGPGSRLRDGIVRRLQALREQWKH